MAKCALISERRTGPGPLAAGLAALLAAVFCSAASGQSGDDFETRLIKAAEAVRHNVVAISAHSRQGENADAVARFSGILLDDKGHIATVAEAVERIEKLYVRLFDGRELEATVVGADKLTNIAVIKALGTGFVPVKPAPETAPPVGTTVIAVGNPFGLSHSVSTGIISGVERTLYGHDGRLVSGMIQTTAPINPGDAGGLLADSRGRFLGMVFSTFGRAPSIRKMQKMLEGMMKKLNSDPELRKLVQEIAGLFFSGIDSEHAELMQEKMEELRARMERDSPEASSGGLDDEGPGSFASVGINFAVPGSTVARIADSLIRRGKVVRGRIGLRCLSLSAYHRSKYGLPADLEGVLVADVTPGGPSEKAGLKRFDVICAFKGGKVGDTVEFMKKVYAEAPGSRIELKVWRKDAPAFEVTVTVEELD